MSYCLSKKVEMDFETAVKRVVEELTREGFGVLTEIDVKATFKKKLDVNFRNYRILGACNPPFAYRALMAEPNIGTMLPCNVIVQECADGTVEVSAIKPLDSMQAVENAALRPVAEEIQLKLGKVVDSL